MSVIEALYIFDEHNSLIFDHIYDGIPPDPATLLTLYLQHALPRPSVIHIPSIHPPTILFSIIQDNLLFFSPASSEIGPLLVLEFLHRVTDALEEFIGSPLLATKITSNYDILAQIVAEMADGGIVCQGEANALRDVVETGPGVLKNLLGGVGLPGTSPSLPGTASNTPFARAALQPAQSSQGSAIPWRRSNIRYTSNEMYVDIIESLSVTLAPSGRPIAAFAHGSVAFTSKVSGVPDLLLTLTTNGKGAGMGTRGDQIRNIMQRPVFHPCVRLSRWKSEGVLSFVPPDGKFALCGYEVDLLGPDLDFTIASSTNLRSSQSLDLPAQIQIDTSLGSAGTDFEVRLIPTSPLTPSRTAAQTSLHSNLTSSRSTHSASPAPPADPKIANLENLCVTIPLPVAVRGMADLRPTRGEAAWVAAESVVEWRVPTREFLAGGMAGVVLRCSVLGPVGEGDGVGDSMGEVGLRGSTYDYDEDGDGGEKTVGVNGVSGKINGDERDGSAGGGERRDLMPSCVMLSFGVKGWLASGIKVESLVVDARKSRGLGAELKPYKGVKYVTRISKTVTQRLPGSAAQMYLSHIYIAPPSRYNSLADTIITAPSPY